jgi:hypothetical protein
MLAYDIPGEWAFAEPTIPIIKLSRIATIGQKTQGLRDRFDFAARSDKKQTAIEIPAAVIYIGMVRSCAVVSLYPRS